MSGSFAIQGSVLERCDDLDGAQLEISSERNDERKPGQVTLMAEGDAAMITNV
jgi:hypothetical protein